MGGTIWYVLALPAAFLGVAALMFGFSLMPAFSLAQEQGKTVPWFFTWAMILSTAACAFVVAGVLAKAGTGIDSSMAEPTARR
jgi:hypothetical protein